MTSKTGFLVLQKDIRNSNDWLRAALNKLGTHCCQGNALDGFYEYVDEPSMSFEPGTFCQFGEGAHVPVINRNSTVSCWFDGALTNQQEIDEFTDFSLDVDNPGIYPIKLLITLNSYRHSVPQDKNYAFLVKDRVTDKMRGKWSMVLAYLSQHPRFILSNHNSDLFIRFAYTEHAFIILWSNNMNFDSELRQALGEEEEKLFWYNVTPLAGRSLLVVHPMFLIDKFRKWNRKYKFSGRLMVVSILERYLNTIAVPEL